MVHRLQKLSYFSLGPQMSSVSVFYNIHTQRLVYFACLLKYIRAGLSLSLATCNPSYTGSFHIRTRIFVCLFKGRRFFIKDADRRQKLVQQKPRLSCSRAGVASEPIHWRDCVYVWASVECIWEGIKNDHVLHILKKN